MNGYTKLFGSIIASTIWRETTETKVVWITMLAMANKHGIVEASVPGLADMARVPLDDTQKALEILASPDTFSRTKDFEGRRIEAVDGGWVILNHAKYREKMSADERRQYNRLKQQEFRERQKRALSTSSQQSSITVNHGHSPLPMSAHAEEEAKELKPPIPEVNGSAKAQKTENQARAERLFKRRATTLWDASERKAWQNSKATIDATDEDDWKLLEWFFALPASEPTYRRRDLATLLNHWGAEIDRAREYRSRNQRSGGIERVVKIARPMEGDEGYKAP